MRAGALALAGCLLVAVDSGAAPAPAATPAPAPARPEGFVVQPFTNASKTRALEHLAHGLPALIAERLASEPPLRFEGGVEPFARGPVAARWLVAGSFARQKDWRVAVTVEIRPVAAPEEVAAQATRIGGKDQVPATALEAALAALSEVPGLKLDPAAVSPAVKAPLSPDPYAFVLYGRAVALAASNLAPAVRDARAVAMFMRALVIDPRVPETRRALAVQHLAGGRPGHARAALTYALELRPDYVAALRSLAALDRAAGLPTARERYARLVTLDPHDLPARRALGELLAEAGQLEDAQRELEAVLAAAPEDLEARRSLVLVLAARRAGPELVAALEEVVRLDPENVDGRMDLGAAYLSVGNAKQAEAVFDEVLRRRPKHPPALKLAADLARERGDLELAAAMYARLRAVAPNDPRPLFLMAAAHAQAGNLDQAERLFTEGSFLPGMRGDALSNLGALALQRQQPKQALWYLSRAAKLRPEKAGVRYNHALALHQVGNDAVALGELRAAEELDPTDVGVRFLAGVVSLRLGLLEEAAASFRGALALDPKHADARHNLSLLEGMGIGSETSASFVEDESGVRLKAPSRPLPGSTLRR